MKPVQYAQVSYVAHFSRLLFLIRDKRIFSFFLILFKGGGGLGMGGCGGGDIRRSY